MKSPLEKFFQWYGIPPTGLHAEIQKAALRAGWIPPWDIDKQRRPESDQQRHQTASAGRKSGQRRRAHLELRRSIVSVVRTRLKPKFISAPYSQDAVDALEEEYRAFLADPKQLAKHPNDLSPIAHIILSICSREDLEKLQSVSRDTLLHDLKHLNKPRMTKRSR
jgi:hypothetical protein